MNLFDRRVAMLVADKLFAKGMPLRMTFRVNKSADSEPNTAALEISNLGSELREKLSERGTPIVLEAGYEEGISQIFAGRIMHAEHDRTAANLTTSLECEDDAGATAARINASFGPGTRLADIIDAAVTALGVGRGNIDQIIAESSFRKGLLDLPRGTVLHGRAIDELDRVMRTAGYRWSIQDGQLQALRPGQATDVHAVRLTPASGLIGHVTAAEQGAIKLRALLRGQLRPADRIDLQSSNATGLYRLETISHIGDTYGRDWYTDMEAHPA